MTPLEPTALARTAATTVGWVVYITIRFVFLFPSRLVARVLAIAARPARGLLGAPAAAPVAELASLLEQPGQPASALRAIATRSRASDLVGIVRGRLLRGGRPDGARPRQRRLRAEMVAEATSLHACDAPLLAAHVAAAASAGAKARTVALAELGFGGLRPPLAPPAPKAIPLGAGVSAWLPGGEAREGLAWLDRLERAGQPFRLLLGERLAPPAAEAARLFRGGAIGTPIHALFRVRVHPARLLGGGGAALARGGWLDEPLLNRVGAAVWMGGPVVGARVLESAVEDAFAVVAVLRHARPGRLSLLELTVTPEAERGGQPAVFDRIELTGRDGFIRVHGIFEEGAEGPRLCVHRGALEQVRRDLDRGPEALVRAAALDLGWTRGPEHRAYELARRYLEACERVARAAGGGLGQAAGTSGRSAAVAVAVA